MPEQNTRVVILGTPRADKEFDLFDNDRAKAQKRLKKLGGDARKLARELRREARKGFRAGRLR